MHFTDEDLIRWLQARNQININIIKAWESHKTIVKTLESHKTKERQKNNLCCVCNKTGFPYCPTHDV